MIANQYNINTLQLDFYSLPGTVYGYYLLWLLPISQIRQINHLYSSNFIILH